MKPQTLVVAISMAMIWLAARPAWAQSTLEPPWAQGALKPPAHSPAKPLPKLAVVTLVQEAASQDRQNVEDLLMIELGNQPFLQLVDRQALQAVMKEHAIALTNFNDAKNASALGKFAGADYLLYVLVVKDKDVAVKDKASVRLVEVATGQVKVDDQVAVSEDLALSMAAVREKVLLALRPESQAANRLTVGIAEFPNRTGTARSEKLGVELQEALRARLSQQPWAVVLEREYPKVLLNEVDLARAGLVNGDAVEMLPPADLVISGNMDDVSRVYEPDKPWEVTLDLSLRLRGQSSQASQTFRSDAIEAAADKVMQEIDEFRRQPAPKTTVPEKELWRRQAWYLMPKPIAFWPKRKNALIPNLGRSNELTRREVVRAWENVLLLDANDAEAMTCLGVCLIGFDPWFFGSERSEAKRAAMTAQWIAASRLIERALAIDPTPDRAVTYVYCIQAMMNGVPARAKEMAQYTLDHPEQFEGFTDFAWIKIALTQILSTTDDKKFGELQRALANAGSDPNAALILFPPGLTRNGPIAQYTALLAPYLDSPEPVAQFAAQRAMGELLCWAKKDPAGLEHLDKAIAVAEAAYQRCKDGHRYSVDAIYRLKIDACGLFDRPEEAKKTAVAGVKHFMEIGRFGDSQSAIDSLYQYCVTKALGPGQEELSLKICDTYIAAAKKYWQHYEAWPLVCAKREEVAARLAGKPVPDMSGLRLVKGAESLSQPGWNGGDLMGMRLAATQGKLWFVPTWHGIGPSMLYNHGRNEISVLSEVSRGARGVAATSDAVFFGGVHGLYKCDTNGKLLKCYEGKNAAFPGDYVFDVCEGGGKIYFSFLGSPQPGIAVLDPATDNITVLAPSSRNAKWEQEPVASSRRVQWDAVTPRLYAGSYFQYNNNRPYLTALYGWSPQDKTWQMDPIKEAPQFIVSNADETLLVRVLDDHCEFHFVKADQTVNAVVPVPTHIGEPAWDHERIWVPTASGLYEVDRATGQVKWLAYQSDNQFFSALKADGRLYIAASRGLYCYGEPPSLGNVRASLANSEAKFVPPPAEAVVAKLARPNAIVQRDEPAAVAKAVSFDLFLEDDAKAEVTITLDMAKVLLKAFPGTVQLDLPAVGDKNHHLYFQRPGYVMQLVPIGLFDGKTPSTPVKVKLFRKRYVVLRCAFNTHGGRNLEGDGVEEQHIALSHWTGAKYFSEDWWIWQPWQNSGDPATFVTTLQINFNRFNNGFGIAKPPSGASYQNMTVAPESGYRCENIKVEKGLVLYCRVRGNIPEGLGYGKILVEAVTETPPDNVRFVESP